MNTPSDEAKPSALNYLLQTCVDGQDGYQLASDSVKDSELKTTLASYAAQRVRFGQELKVFLDDIAEPPLEEPTLTGALHNGWINLKAIIKDGDELAILQECVRGETSAVERYRDAMSGNDVPQTAQSVVQRQAREIMDAHDQMELLSQRAQERVEPAESALVEDDPPPGNT